jgi:transcriptional regulator with XRE-family HTH domain
MTEFGRRLKIARAAKGLNQAAFAELLGVEPASVSRWENGGGFDESRVPRIAEILGKSPEWLVGADDVAGLARRVAELEEALRPAAVEPPSIEEEQLLWLFRNDDAFKSAISALFEARLRMNQEKLPARLRK